MTLVNSLQDGMAFMLALFAALPATINALFVLIVGMFIIIMLARKVSGG